MEGGQGRPGAVGTQSALREGLLDLIQHIPKQRRLVTFSVDGHRLTRLREEREIRLKISNVCFC